MEDISTVAQGSYRYSGIDWEVEIDAGSEDDTIAKGSRVVVKTVEVGLLRVVKK